MDECIIYSGSKCYGAASWGSKHYRRSNVNEDPAEEPFVWQPDSLEYILVLWPGVEVKVKVACRVEMVT